MKLNFNKPRDRHKHYLNEFSKAVAGSVNDHVKDGRKLPGDYLKPKPREGREYAFQLEGLARLEVRMGREPRAAKRWLKHFKGIEDSLGVFDHWNAMAENERQWKLTPELQAHFRKMTDYAVGQVEERLIKEGWLTLRDAVYQAHTEPRERLFEELDDARWHKPRKEAALLARVLRDEAREIHDNFTEGTLALDHIEHGLHEFRRKIRWLGIYTRCTQGKIQLSEGAPNEPLAHWVTPERATDRYNQVPVNPSIEHPVFFLRGGFYALTALIEDLSQLKDPALWTWEISRLGKVYGLKEAQVREILGDDYVSHHTILRDARKVVRRYLHKESLLIRIADYFDRQT
ncbi:MAG: hypothetical protein RJA22_3037 [Verrucomicrobiota bacterium]